jgi:uncharacterized Fe-S radical SAM superfamily protein PflX
MSSADECASVNQHAFFFFDVEFAISTRVLSVCAICHANCTVNTMFHGCNVNTLQNNKAQHGAHTYPHSM